MEGLLFFILVAATILKLIGFLSWSWWWILSPLWVTIGGFILFWVGALLIQFIAASAVIVGWGFWWLIDKGFSAGWTVIKNHFRNGGRF